MPTKNKIPAGYRITSLSYEGDDDNHKTVVVEGLSERKALLLGELAKVLLNRGTGLENNLWADEKALEAAHKVLLPIMERYADILPPKRLEEYRRDIGAIQNFIADHLVGYPAKHDYPLRVLKNIKVELVPYDVPLENVTEKFIR